MNQRDRLLHSASGWVEDGRRSLLPTPLHLLTFTESDLHPSGRDINAAYRFLYPSDAQSANKFRFKKDLERYIHHFGGFLDGDDDYRKSCENAVALADVDDSILQQENRVRW